MFLILILPLIIYFINTEALIKIENIPTEIVPEKTNFAFGKLFAFDDNFRPKRYVKNIMLNSKNVQMKDENNDENGFAFAKRQQFKKIKKGGGEPLRQQPFAVELIELIPLKDENTFSSGARFARNSELNKFAKR
ncbi:hypothetical protein Mgra_00002854 [Meloidogyne graminicola]|uniref:Uncharacterized protein n=1 Tax=Meloidogyne graminicola TaxID=189291 RepID=A0A8S9ZX15_9BILA|nr:hypothetical protein Mgra_00002854 [Meloidogyne graminicola]